MNHKILSKCIDELKKETPNISYVLGMLETLNDLDEKPSYQAPHVPYGSSSGLLGVAIDKITPPTSIASPVFTPEEQAVMAAMDLAQSGVKPTPGVIEVNKILN